MVGLGRVPAGGDSGVGPTHQARWERVELVDGKSRWRGFV